MPIPQLRQLIVQQNIRRGSGNYHNPRGRRPKPKNFSWGRFLKRLGIVAVFLAFAGTIGIIGLFAYVSRDLPDPDKISMRTVAQTTKIYDRTGEVLLYEIHGTEKRTIVELDNIAKCAKDAAIAVEDKDFYNHHGFDLRGIARAIYTDIVQGGKVQGGSTITQQFIKKSVLSDEKTFTRKIKELILAIQIEQRFSKDQILKLYLNQIPYGSVAYGIESASQTFFAKSAKELSLSECALLAALPQAPTYYSPYGSHQKELLNRSHVILNLMVEQGYVEQAAAEVAKQDDVLGRIQPKREAIKAPHFVFHVREQLADQFGDQTVERGGLKVITTLDAEKQEIAEKAVADNRETFKKLGASTAAMMAMDPNNGDVLAMVGSADYFDEEIKGKYNAMLGKLQPGSSIKPIVYAAAFEKGYTPDTVVDDVVTTFQSSPKEYKPLNYDQGERGPVTLKEALAGSLNIPAVKALYLVGIDRFIDFARKLGYSSFTDRSAIGLSLTLGGAEVRPIEHVAAFSAFATEGYFNPARSILKVEDANGKIILDQTDSPKKEKVLDEEVARNINAILSNNDLRSYIFGTSNYLTLGERPAASKTGTTNDFKDAWTVGYTPSLLAGVWVGNADGSAMKKGADGSKIAAPIWNAFMKNSLVKSPVEQFTAPKPIVTGKPILDGAKNAQVMLKIDKFSGKLATELTPPDYVEERGYGIPHSILYFVDKDEPRGPVPASPEKDPQYSIWEDALNQWLVKQNYVPSGEQPPTETDDVHVPENTPTININLPSNDQTVTDRNMPVSVTASAPRGIAKLEFLMDDDLIHTVSMPVMPSISNSYTVPVPNRISKGFRTLKVKAFDDAGNRSSMSVNINFMAELGPLELRWIKPSYDGQRLFKNSSFPYTVNVYLEDPKSVAILTIIARPLSGGSDEELGSLQNPKFNDIGIVWQFPSGLGDYAIIAKAKLTGGEEAQQEMKVYVE